MEAGAALVVKGAQALEGADSRGLEGDALADDIGDVRARLDLLDVGLNDATGHQRISDVRHDRCAACAASGVQMPSDAASTSPTSRPCQAIASWSVRLAT